MGWPPATHWATISFISLYTSASSTATGPIYFVWDSRKGKSTGSDHCLTYIRCHNLVCARMRSNLDLPPATHWATISNLSLSTSASSAATDSLYFDWDSRKGKSTGSDHHLTYIRYYNLVCVRMRSNLGWPPATHWATISYVSLSTSASSTATGPLYFVWDNRKGKSTNSDHHLA